MKLSSRKQLLKEAEKELASIRNVRSPKLNEKMITVGNKRIKEPDLYVVRCTTPIRGRDVGLYGGNFKKGQYVTWSGEPTNDLSKAGLYSKRTDGQFDSFDFEDIISDVTVGDFFEPVGVTIKLA